MSATGLDVFDRTLHKTNIWLKDLMGIMGCEDRHRAYLALSVTLHALRDRLTVEEAAHLAAQLPMLIRGFYYEGWDPSAKPFKERHKDQFLSRIREEIRGDDRIDPEQVARAVFLLFAQRVAESEIADVEHVLPYEIRQLWPDAQRRVASD